MTSKNDVTGDSLISKTNSDAYCAGWDRLFGEPKEKEPLKDHQIRELVNSLTKVAQEYSDTEQLRAQIRKLVIEALKEKTGWQEIETAPKDGSRFLAWRKHCTAPCIVRWDVAYDEAENQYGEHVYHLTHWMPLPEPPKSV